MWIENTLLISISTSLLKEKVVNKQVKANYVIFQKNTQLLMNASSNVSNVEIANKIATTAALFRKYFPDASVNFSPWDNSNNESMQDTIDFAFHFPGWSPLIECRAILLQLRIENNNNERYDCSIRKMESGYHRWLGNDWHSSTAKGTKR